MLENEVHNGILKNLKQWKLSTFLFYQIHNFNVIYFV